MFTFHTKEGLIHNSRLLYLHHVSKYQT